MSVKTEQKESTMNQIKTLEDLTGKIKDFESDMAPGSETWLWGEYVERMRQITGRMPWADDAADATLPAEEIRWWIRAYEHAESHPTHDRDRVFRAADAATEQDFS